jgi:hypothetical protein
MVHLPSSSYDRGSPVFGSKKTASPSRLGEIFSSEQTHHLGEMLDLRFPEDDDVQVFRPNDVRFLTFRLSKLEGRDVDVVGTSVVIARLIVSVVGTECAIFLGPSHDILLKRFFSLMLL